MQTVIDAVLDDPRLLLVLVVLVAVAFGVYWLRQAGGAPRDGQRLFDSAQRSLIKSRAGGRCEHKHPLWRRCRSPGTQADHIYPHARGGATTLANGQSLCQMHNARKSAKVPSSLYLWRLQRRRRRYFPPGHDATVQWRQPSLFA
ncbi:HNH endonuclease [Pseudactinotalea sp. Z1748]|uniref:HNH endonuclease n=1 Tax=Pseudactinotalea sp. Z1748 TaxID=3413027 RepID=UPI003C7D74B7